MVQAKSLACENGTSATEAFDALKTVSPSIPQIRLASRFAFLPLNTDADILAFTPHSPDQTIRFRAIWIADDGKGKQPRTIDSDQIWAEAATSGVGGTDFKHPEDSSAKTLIHFRPVTGEDDSWVFWKPVRFYLIGCTNGNIPHQYGQFNTNVTNKWLCLALAVLICAVFYVLAAFGTFYIHRSQRVYKGSPDSLGHGLNGTHYASLLHHFNPVVLTAGSNGRGNATKLQILFFSMVVFGLVSYVWMSTGYLSDLSSTILLLMGISGLGATISAATDVSKSRLDFDNWAWLINRHWLPKGGVAEAIRAQWKDIVMTDGEFDVYRFQMVIFSVLVGMALLGAGGKMSDLSTFTIPGALLGILGLSQTVYIAGKLAAPPAISQLNEQISTLRVAECALQTALSKRDQAATSAGPAPLPLDRSELTARVGDVYDKYIDAWETTRTMFESTLSREVSAVAAGCRPPFPYLRPTTEVMTVLRARFEEIDAKAGALKATVDSQAPGDPSLPGKINAFQAAISEVRSQLDSVQQSVSDFDRQMKDSGDQSPVISSEAANAKARARAMTESAVRNALDAIRQRIDQLGQLLKDNEALVRGNPG